MVCHPSVVLGTADMPSNLLLPTHLFAPRSGSSPSMVFLYLESRICHNCNCMQLFLAPYSFLVFFAQGDICPSTSIAAQKQRVLCPSMFQNFRSSPQGGKDLNSTSVPSTMPTSVPEVATRPLGTHESWQDSTPPISRRAPAQNS